MSKDHGSGANAPGIHVEWSPGRVQAVDIANGRRRSAATIGELTAFLGGQKQILVGLGRQITFLKVVSLPRAAQEDLRRILAIQMGQHFPLPPDQLAFDFFQTNKRLDDGLETVIAAVRAEDLRALNAELQAAGIRAARVLPVALGAVGVAAHSTHPAAIVVETTNGLGSTLDVVADGIVRLSRTVPESGNLEQEVYRTIAASGVAEPVVIAAGPSALEGAASRQLAGAQQSARGALDLLHEAPPFNLELAEQRELEHRKRVSAHQRLAGLLMAAALCFVLVVWNQRSKDEAAVVRGQGNWARKIDTQKSISEAYTRTAMDATGMSTTLKSAFQVAQPLADTASVVGDSLPKSAWLTALTMERGKIVQLRGTSTDPDAVASLLKNLSATGRFRDIKLVVANSGKISSTPIVQFNVSAFPIGNLPMPEPDKKKPGAARPATGTATTGTATTEAKS